MEIKHLLILSDSLSPWHSVWIRIGQYLPNINCTYDICSQLYISKTGIIRGIRNDGQLTDTCDLIFIYRWTVAKEQSYVLNKAIVQGTSIPIVADIDDNLWQAGGQWTRSHLINFTHLLRYTSVITCSNINLKQMLNSMLPGKQIIIIANSAPTILRQPNSKEKKKIRVGWTGAPWTRPDDLLKLQSTLNWITTQKNLQLVHVGHHKNKKSLSEILNLNPQTIETYDLQPYEKYLQLLDFDIGLAPLQANIFNNYKSEIKLLEYSSQGIPWIASDTIPYQDLCKEWNWNGRLASKTEEWIWHIKQLINSNIRYPEAIKLQRLSQSKRSHYQISQEWEVLLMTILKEAENQAHTNYAESRYQLFE